MCDSGAARPGRSVWSSSITAVTDGGVFARFAAGHGADADRLRADLPALLGFLADHPELADDDELVASASVVLGGVIIAAHPYTRWVRTPELEIEGPGMNLVIEPITRTMITDRGAHRGFLETLAGWPQARLDEQELDALDDDLSPLESAPEGFVLPDLTVGGFTDADGTVIDYGHRWLDGPPDDAYSRTSHTERFAPLHGVAEALITFLTATYDVTAEPGTDPDGRCVRLRPSTGSPVTIVFTGFPGLRVRAGAFFAGHYPSCGCDACDETVGPVAQAFVDAVLGIVGGGLTEHYPVGTHGWSHSRLRTVDGGEAGRGEPDFGPERAAEVVRVLAGLDDGHWPAWPRRDGATAFAREPPGAASAPAAR